MPTRPATPAAAPQSEVSRVERAGQQERAADEDRHAEQLGHHGDRERGTPLGRAPAAVVGRAPHQGREAGEKDCGHTSPFQ